MNEERDVEVLTAARLGLLDDEHINLSAQTVWRYHNTNRIICSGKHGAMVNRGGYNPLRVGILIEGNYLFWGAFCEIDQASG